MKAILSLLVLFPLTVMAESDRSYNPYPDTGAQRAVENARAGNQAEIERIIRREVEKRRHQNGSSKSHENRRSVPPPPPSRDRDQNCGQSFWEKSEAIRLCPEATAMKARAKNGEAYYYCDCE